MWGDSLGGYILHVDLPCEEFIGRTILWVILLIVSPFLCPVVPWLCCPLDIPDDNPYSISPNITCDNAGAAYGASMFWTMQGVAIIGLTSALASLAKCAVETTSKIAAPEYPDFLVLGDIPASLVQVTEEPPETGSQFDLLGTIRELLTIHIKDDADLGFLLAKNGSGILDAGREADESDVITPLEGQAEFQTEDKNDKGGIDVKKVETEEAEGKKKKKKNRRRRQAELNIPIPTLVAHYTGPDDNIDSCDRDEIVFPDGDCHELLTQGPCDETEYVLMDPHTKKGYCAPRLCGPDRVFVFGDQKCHDPNEPGICPPGRRLFSTSFGTPVCGCPDGTYEADDDLDDDVCENVLATGSTCNKGQVLWFKDFSLPPECVPDPCGGQNLRRGPKDLPYVPALKDGRCYQIGQQAGVCSPDSWYSMDMTKLRGVCVSLDDAGYLVLEPKMLEILIETYGPLLPSERTSPISGSTPSSSRPSKEKTKTISTTSDISSPTIFIIGAPVMPIKETDREEPMVIGQSAVPVFKVSHKTPPENKVGKSLGKSMMSLLPTHATAFSPPIIMVNGSTSHFFHFFSGLSHFGQSNDDKDSRSKRSPLHRVKRAPLPYATPGNVIEAGLSSCRAGAARDHNAKCRSIILPSRFPHDRPKRTVPAIKPSPSCGGYWGASRQCKSSGSSVSNAITSLGLG
ncbi:uncharacterized protein LOC143020507 [Oratosquilla oratoria]|uniref:uncharacterized protein LOC143020507 n=1 Tax=Oratosquilla oratoria TaxID=337810 RepID=UPI003F7629A3